jgi:hypothetical protein
MRGRQQICIICRNIGRPSRVVTSGRRAASQLRSLEPYDASKLILDLDAADSKYVRRYEDQQEEKATSPPKSVRDAKAQAEARKRHDPKAIPDLYRPNPIDFMRYALVDDVWKHNAHKSAFLRHVLSKCFLSGLGKFKDHIKWSRAYEVLPHKMDQLLHVPDDQVLQGIKSAFSDCKNIQEISRITAIMTRTVDGCKFVSSNGNFILNTLGLEVPRRNSKRRGTLRYINAVIQKLETMGVDPGPQWYGSGMYHAARTLSYPALKKYIDVAMKNNDTAEKIDIAHIRATLECLMGWPVDSKSQRRVKFINESDSRKRDLLRLLTGWDNLGVPEGDENRKPCFALLLRDDRTTFEAYIENLIKLEADEALWYELTNVDLAATPDGTSKGDDSALFQRADLLARVFISLGDPLRALQVLCKDRRLRSSDRDRPFSEEEPTPSSSETQPQSSIDDQASSSNKDQIPSNENNPPSSTVDGTLLTSILSIPGLSQNRRLQLRSALAKRHLMTEVYDVDKGSLFKGLKRLDLYTPENMSDIVSVLSAYWTEAQDYKIRKWMHDYGPNNLVVQMAKTGVSRRLAALGEEWETRRDISDWYVPEDVQRLKRLQVDLLNLKPWTEAEDGYEMIVSNSWPGGVDGCTPEDGKDMARENDQSVAGVRYK